MVADFHRFDTAAVDIETTGISPLDSRILLVQIGFPEHQYVIDANKVDLYPLMPFLKSNKWKKLLFNGKFDEQFFLKNYDTPINNIFDCFIAEKVLAPESKWGNSFEDLAFIYLKVQLNKDIRKSFLGKTSGTFSEEQIKYSAEDVEYLFPLYEKQREKLENAKLSHIAELEFELVTVVSNMELNGVPINSSLWKEILAEYAEEHRESYKKTLSIFTGTTDFIKQEGLFEDGPEVPDNGKKPLNIGSPVQLKQAFANLGIHVPNTKEQTISIIKHPAAEALMEYRKLDKIMTSYGDSFLDKIHPFSGRIHAEWKQIGTETGRFSCAKPNLQQVPPRFRTCIGGEEDYVLVGADFSQMELRILAEESGDPLLTKAFTEGLDVHSVTASTMFNVPLEQVTKEQRFIGKTLNFGITYGMKVKKFVDMMNAEANKEGRKNITLKQGSTLLNKYKDTYRTANQYLEAVGLKALREGKTQTRFGRKRSFTPVPTTINPDAYRGQIEAIKRQGANMPIQGTNADITKIAMVNLHHDLKDFGFRGNIILQVHDEIVVLAHKSQAEAIKPMLVQSMEEAGKTLVPNIPIVVDAYVSDYWKK